MSLSSKINTKDYPTVEENHPTFLVTLTYLTFLGDNKECNRSLDFPDSHSAIYLCRFCRIDKYEMYHTTDEKVELLRTEQNYNEDVETNNMTLTGVKSWSVFNSMPYFHVVRGTTNDLTHDLLEGSMPYCFHGAFKLLIDKGKIIIKSSNSSV